MDFELITDTANNPIPTKNETNPIANESLNPLPPITTKPKYKKKSPTNVNNTPKRIMIRIGAFMNYLI